MAPLSVSHPSDSEWRELRAISREAVQEAAFIGQADRHFRGFHLLAVRRGQMGRGLCQVDICIQAEGASSASDRAWDKVAVPFLATVNPL